MNTDRVTVIEAAERLATTPDAVRARLRRGQLAGEKQGRTWYVFLDSQATVNDSQTVKPSSRETVDTTVTRQSTTVNRQSKAAGDSQTVKPSSRETVKPTVNDSQATVSEQDIFDDLLDCDPSIRAAVLEANLRGAQALLRHTETELAATREEVVFLREQLAQKDVVISRLSEAQVEALRRRDILDAQERNALPKPVASRAWWRFWR